MTAAAATTGPRPPPPRASGLRRWLYVAAGCVCVALAVAGAVLPMLPCTPWVLAAGFFFARSSERLDRWLRRVPYFGHILKDWDAHRGVRPWVKGVAVACVVGFVSLAALVILKELWMKWVVVGLGVVGVCVVMLVVPTVRPGTMPADRTEG